MALRQKLALPGFEWHLKGELKQVKASRPPKEVEFRRGSDPSNVVADILPYSSVRLCAPVGSGKSVIIPTALASVTRALVFHVVPNRQLVGHLFDYLVKSSQRERAVTKAPFEKYCGDVDSVPRNGVFLISAVDMVDLMMRHGGLTKFKGCSVFLDEAHESDAYTHVVRTLAVQLGADRLIQASATFNPVVHGVRATPGSVIMKAVDLGAPDEWEVDRAGSPFQVGTMRDGVLVFVDSRSAANKLVVAYERAGLDVFRLTSLSTDEEVAQAMRAANDKNGGLFAILADYTYRSGFTFPVSRVVDVGEISYYDSTPGEFRRLTRRMFEFEREQAAGRVGRIADNAEYYFQKGVCEAIMCDLEGVEKEAAAYIYRCLGYLPDGVLAGAYMSTHDLPESLSVRAALNGPYPLTYCVKHSSEAAKLPGNDYVERGAAIPKSVTPPPSYSGEREQSVSGKRDSGFAGEEDTAWGSMLEDLALNEQGLILEDGIYYISQVRDTARRGVAATLTFPSGLQSVRQFAMRQNFEFAVRSLSREDRAWALGAVLDRYNTITAQIKGAKAAVKQCAGKERTWDFVDKVKGVIEQLSADHADALSCLRAAEGFAMSPTWVTSYNGELKAELAAKEGFIRCLEDVAVKRGHADLDEDIGAGMDAHVKRGVLRDRDRGRGADNYDGRKYELKLPTWMSGRKITYEDDYKPGRDKQRLTIMRNDHGQDDPYVYEYRYTKVTEWL